MMEEGRPAEEPQNVAKETAPNIPRGSFSKYLDRLLRLEPKPVPVVESVPEHQIESSPKWRGFFRRSFMGSPVTEQQLGVQNDAPAEEIAQSQEQPVLTYEQLAAEPPETPALRPFAEQVSQTSEDIIPGYAIETQLGANEAARLIQEKDNTAALPAVEISDDGTMRVIHRDVESEPSHSPQKDNLEVDTSILPPEAASLDQADILLHHAKEVAPERVLEQVATAAEHDVPVEKVYEKRHEVKDAPTNRGPVSVGSILAGTTNRVAITPQVLTAPPEPKPQISFISEPSQIPPVNPTELYKNAVKNGFLIAMGIVAFIVVYILTR